MITIVAVVELRNAIAISGVAVLTYYAITNAAALTLTGEQRRWSPVIAVVGLVGCVALITSLPPTAILTGTATLAARGRRSGDHHTSSYGRVIDPTVRLTRHVGSRRFARSRRFSEVAFYLDM